MTHLPEKMRPKGLRTRDFRPGFDLPSWFHDDIKALDEKLHFVWHPYQVLYDDVMNADTGSADDPRHNITEWYGQEVWGFPMTDNKGVPLPENRWHIWRLCDPYGWCHVVGVEATEKPYLRLILERLQLQDNIKKYGAKAWGRYLSEQQEELMARDQEAQNDEWQEVQKMNSGFLKRVQENFERGIIKPTRPTKKIITSYPGQSNRTAIERPLTDREGGLILPDDWGRD